MYTRKRLYHLFLFCRSIWLSHSRNHSFSIWKSEEVQVCDCSQCPSWMQDTVLWIKTAIYILLLHFHLMRFYTSSLQLLFCRAEVSIFHISSKTFLFLPVAHMRKHPFVTINFLYKGRVSTKYKPPKRGWINLISTIFWACFNIIYCCIW